MARTAKQIAAQHKASMASAKSRRVPKWHKRLRATSTPGLAGKVHHLHKVTYGRM